MGNARTRVSSCRILHPRREAGHERARKSRGSFAPAPARSQQGDRERRAAAPRRLPIEPRRLRTARRRRDRDDAHRRRLDLVAEIVHGRQAGAGTRGRPADRARRAQGRHQVRRLRPRRVPVSRTRQGACRRRTLGGIEDLMVDIAESRELKERVVEINRVAKVVKGGRRFSFTALVVIGDESDRVGVGYGKAREVPLAISKAVDDAKKNLFTVPKHGQTITHEVIGQFGAARVLLRPASPGTGVIAGGGVRAVLELGGIRDVLAKSLGTTNPINMLKAAESALRHLRRPEDVARARGKSISEVLPPAKLPAGEEGPAAATVSEEVRAGGEDQGDAGS